MRSGQDMEVSWEIFNGPWMGDMEGCLVGKYRRTPAGRYGRMVGLTFLTGPRLGGPEGCLVGNSGRTLAGRIGRIFG